MSASRIVLLFAALVATLAPQSAFPKSPVKAFTVHLRETYSGSRPPSFEPDRVIARKSDGSYTSAYNLLSPDGESGTVVQIVNVRDSNSIYLQPFTKTKSTYYHTGAEMESRVNAMTNCDRWKPVSAKTESATILGLRAVHVITKEVGGGTWDSWIAPDLDCFPLVETYTSRTGNRNERIVTLLEFGEPAEVLFAIPPDFIEVSPLQQEALYNAKYPGKSLWEYALQPLADQYFRGREK